MKNFSVASDMSRKKEINYGKLIKRLSTVQDQVKFLQVSENLSIFFKNIQNVFFLEVWGILLNKFFYVKN